jgi:transcriptional regulator GlxA family with amidase domain
MQALLVCFVTGEQKASAIKKLPLPLQFAVQALDVQIFEKQCKPIALAELAKRCHVGPEHLCRLFSKHLGMGPIQYFMKKRLEQAATLLTRSNLTVKEVAAATGFEDPYHFSKAFSKRYGVPPLKYRNP